MLSLKDFKKLEIIKNFKNISGGRVITDTTKTGCTTTVTSGLNDKDDD